MWSWPPVGDATTLVGVQVGDSVRNLDLSDDGALVRVAYEHGRVELRERATGQLQQGIELELGPTFAQFVGPDRAMVVEGDAALRVLDISDGAISEPHPRPTPWPDLFLVSPGDCLVAVAGRSRDDRDEYVLGFVGPGREPGPPSFTSAGPPSMGSTSSSTTSRLPCTPRVCGGR